MVRGGDLDPGELLAGGAEFMHVTHCHHRVTVGGDNAVGRLERRIGQVCAPGARLRAARALRTRPAGERHQRDIALAQRDRLRGVRDVDQVRGAAGIGRLHVAQAEAEVVRHRQGSQARRVARAEIAVDVIALQPRVLERALRYFGVQLRDRFVLGLAGRMLVGPDDAGLSLDAHHRHFRLKCTPA
jgi:hypothetical protein